MKWWNKKTIGRLSWFEPFGFNCQVGSDLGKGGRCAVCYVFLTTWPPYPSLKRNNHHWHIIMVLPPVTMGDVQQFMEVHPCSHQQHIFSSGSAEYSNKYMIIYFQKLISGFSISWNSTAAVDKIIKGEKEETLEGECCWSNWYRSNHSFE